MKRLIACFLILAFILTGCAKLGTLVSLGAAGYGIYKAVKK